MGSPLGQLRVAIPKRYRRLQLADGRCLYIHQIRAERALGKPLPPDAVVHHADGTKRDDAPLVICQNEAYHFLLHQRMRVVRAGGNPNTDKICSGCQQLLPLTAFRPSASTGVQGYCVTCQKKYQQRWNVENRSYRNRKRRAEYALKGSTYKYIHSPEVRTRQNELRRLRRAAGKRN